MTRRASVTKNKVFECYCLPSDIADLINFI